MPAFPDWEKKSRMERRLFSTHSPGSGEEVEITEYIERLRELCSPSGEMVEVDDLGRSRKITIVHIW